MNIDDILYYFINDSSLWPSKIKYKEGRKYKENISKTYTSHPYDNQLANHTLSNSPRYPSTNSFTRKPLDIKKLLTLLKSSYILQKDSEHQKYYSTTPSAGAIYPIEIFLFINNIMGARKGIYHYQRENGTLTYIRQRDFSFIPTINDFIKDAPFFIILVADLTELLNKYGSRGYRYALIECGHLGQLFHMTALKHSVSACPIGGFYDKELINILQLRKNNYPLYLYAFGYKDLGIQ